MSPIVINKWAKNQGFGIIIRSESSLSLFNKSGRRRRRRLTLSQTVENSHLIREGGNLTERFYTNHVESEVDAAEAALLRGQEAQQPPAQIPLAHDLQEGHLPPQEGQRHEEKVSGHV